MALHLLPAELLVMVLSYISDPMDLMALRLTRTTLNKFIAPSFDQLYNTTVNGYRFPFSREYVRLVPPDRACSACEVLDDHRFIHDNLEPLHAPMLYRDAFLYHAVINNHDRHARSLCASPYPRLEIDGMAHEIIWVGWDEALVECARTGQTDMLRLLVAHKPPSGSRFGTWDPLSWAVLSGHIEEAFLLLQSDIPSSRSSPTFSAPYLAIRRHEVQLLESILAAAPGPIIEIDQGECEILAAVTGGDNDEGGWCQRLIWSILEHGSGAEHTVEHETALVGWVPRTRAGHEHATYRGLLGLNRGIGLCLYDSVLHAMVKAGRRNCGMECEVWNGVQYRLTEEELWDVLVSHAANPDHLNSSGVSARDLMEAKRRGDTVQD